MVDTCRDKNDFFKNGSDRNAEGTYSDKEFAYKREDTGKDETSNVKFKADRTGTNISDHAKPNETDENKTDRMSFESSVSDDTEDGTKVENEFYTEWNRRFDEDASSNEGNFNGSDSEINQNESETLTGEYQQSDKEHKEARLDEEYFKAKKDIKTFDTILTPGEWKSTEPQPQKPKKLVRGRTDMFAHKFNQFIPSCVLKFEYQDVKPVSKHDDVYFGCEAERKHKSCGIFKFVISDKPQYDKYVRVYVLVLRPMVLHQRGDIK